MRLLGPTPAGGGVLASAAGQASGVVSDDSGSSWGATTIVVVVSAFYRGGRVGAYLVHLCCRHSLLGFDLGYARCLLPILCPFSVVVVSANSPSGAEFRGGLTSLNHIEFLLAHPSNITTTAHRWARRNSMWLSEVRLPRSSAATWTLGRDDYD